MSALNEFMQKIAEVKYHGHTFPGYNHPIKSDSKDKKKMVLAKKGDQVKLIHFGQKGYKHNYSDAAKKNYLARSAGIRGKGGKLTKDDKFSANYWARRVLWPKGEADGSAKESAEMTRFLHDPMGPPEPDGGMSKSQLMHIAEMAQHLDELMTSCDELPGWVTQHIAVAQENLEQVLSYIGPRAKMSEEKPWEKENPKKKHKELSSDQKSEAKRKAREAGRPYPNLVDNMNAAKKASVTPLMLALMAPSVMPKKEEKK